METQRAINLTSHPINLYSRDGRNRIITKIEPSGAVARVAMRSSTPYGTVNIEGHEIPVVLSRSAERVVGLPDAVEGVYYIVSLPVARHEPTRTDLIVPHDSVRNHHGTIIGCRMFARPI